MQAKTILLFIGVTLIFNIDKINAQGGTCATATPLCNAVGIPLTYSNICNGSTAQTGPSYGCMCSEPNPNWFYIKSSSAGTMHFTISQSSGDVDFTAWGPFTSTTFSNACSNLDGACQGGCSTAVNPPCSGGIADCSYSINAIENMTLVATAPYQYFIIIITNYVGTCGTISITENSGPAPDCSFTPCPTLTVSSTSDTICAGLTTTLSVTGAGIGGTYTWATHSGSISTGTVTSAVFSPTISTTYTVTGIDTTVGCISSVTQSIYVNSINIQTAQDTICIGATITLTVSGANTYTWSSNAGSVTTNTVLVSPTVNSTYSVVGTDSRGCLDTTFKAINIINCTTGIGQVTSIGNQIVVYPNPANSTLYITCKLKNSMLFITDILGNKIKQVNIDSELTSIDTSNLSEGVYFINIQTANGTITKKVIVQR